MGKEGGEGHSPRASRHHPSSTGAVHPTLVAKQASHEPFSPCPHCAPNVPYRLSSTPRPHPLPVSPDVPWLRIGSEARCSPGSRDEASGLDLAPAFSVWVVKQERGPEHTPRPRLPGLSQVTPKSRTVPGWRLTSRAGAHGGGHFGGVGRLVRGSMASARLEAGERASARTGGHICEAGVEGTRRPGP